MNLGKCTFLNVAFFTTSTKGPTNRFAKWLVQSFQARPERSYSLGSASLAAPPFLRSERDEKTIALHEAGHVLAYALIDEDLTPSASIKEKGDSQGRVGSTGKDDRILTRSELEWQMLLSLSGQAAEIVLMGQPYNGSVSDQGHWYTHAVNYLDNGFGEVVYVETPSAEEVEHKMHVLKRLRERQLTYLVRFQEANKEVLKHLAATLEREKEMDAAALESFLERVRVSKPWRENEVV